MERSRECFILQKHNHNAVKEEAAPGTDITFEVEEGKTNRGGTYLFYKGNTFVKCSGGKDTIHYRCSNYTKHCRARIWTKDGKAFLTGSHNHD
jgi:hypothetical protein